MLTSWTPSLRLPLSTHLTDVAEWSIDHAMRMPLTLPLGYRRTTDAGERHMRQTFGQRTFATEYVTTLRYGLRVMVPGAV